MQKAAHVGLPPRFFDSNEFQEIKSVYGKQTSQWCLNAMVRLYDLAFRIRSDGELTRRDVTAVCSDISRRKAKAMLECMVRVGLLTPVPEGFAIVGYLKYNLSRTQLEGRRAQRDGKDGRRFYEQCIASKQEPDGWRPAPHPAEHTGPHKEPHKEEHIVLHIVHPSIEQNQGSTPFCSASLPREGERSESGTAEKEAPPSNVLPLPVRPTPQATQPPDAPASQAGQQPQASTAVDCGPKSAAKKAGELCRPTTVERTTETPIILHRAKKSAQRVTLATRKSSAVTAGQEMPMRPTAAQVILAVAKSGVWPGDSLHAKHAEWIVQQSFTIEEINDALAHFKRRAQTDNPARLPSLLCTQLTENRGRKADAAQRKPVLHAHPQRRNADKVDVRAQVRDAINAHMGDGLHIHHCLSGAYLDAFIGIDPDVVVSMYAESMAVGADDRWQHVATAMAKGQRPRQTGALPPLNNEAYVADIIRTLNEKLSMNVQSRRLDNMAQAG